MPWRTLLKLLAYEIRNVEKAIILFHRSLIDKFCGLKVLAKAILIDFI